MHYHTLTFADIMVKNILYYEHDAPELCQTLCGLLKITYLPNLNGTQRHHYNEETGLFDRESNIPEERRVRASNRLFTEETLKAFKAAKEEQAVLFVYEGKTLVGIVQLYDFNRNVVLQTIQDDVLVFERLLRRHLVNCNKTDDDLRSYFEHRRNTESDVAKAGFYKKKIKDFDRRQEERNSLSDFQTADFKDLIEFASSSFSGHLLVIADCKKLWKLRNLAMHAKDSVGRDLVTNLYTVEGLKQLLDQLTHLETCYYELLTLVTADPDYQENRRLENRARLEQITHLGDRALSYFLNS